MAQEVDGDNIMQAGDLAILDAGAISGYDVFINYGLRWSSLNADGKTSVTDWFAAGGDYVGLGYRGRAIDFAVDAGWQSVDFNFQPALKLAIRLITRVSFFIAPCPQCQPAGRIWRIFRR